MTTHPVDSTTRTCCRGIGSHTQNCSTVAPNYFADVCKDLDASQLWELADYARAAAEDMDAVALRDAACAARNAAESGAITRALLRLVND